MKTVGQVMRTDVPVLSPETGIAEAARLMKAHAAWGLPVLDGEKIIGIITDGDLLSEFHMLVGSYSYEGDSEKFAERVKHFLGLRVKNAMTMHPKTVKEGAGVDEAAETIKQLNVKRLIVVDAKGKYAGMVERIHVINAILD